MSPVANAAPATTTPPSLIARIMGTIEERIDGRMLAPGARLPSLRAFAAQQGVSPSTVVEAYERLAAQGVIAVRRGSGFYVAERPRPLKLAAMASQAEREVDPLWVMRRSLEVGPNSDRPGCGWLPESWMPVEALRQGLRVASRADGPALTEYGSLPGHAPLRMQLARRLGTRGVDVEPAQVLLTDSGTQALDLVCRLLLSPGDTVLVDDPCYFNFLGLARAYRARVISAASKS